MLKELALLGCYHAPLREWKYKCNSVSVVREPISVAIQLCNTFLLGSNSVCWEREPILLGMDPIIEFPYKDNVKGC
jgi:hypothetical protein